MDSSHRVEELQRRHKRLDKELKDGMKDRADSLFLATIKRKKLQVKDEIFRLSKDSS